MELGLAEGDQLLPSSAMMYLDADADIIVAEEDGELSDTITVLPDEESQH